MSAEEVDLIYQGGKDTKAYNLINMYDDRNVSTDISQADINLKEYLNMTNVNNVTQITSLLPHYAHNYTSYKSFRNIYIEDDYLPSSAQLIGPSENYIETGEVYDLNNYSFDSSLVNPDLIDISSSIAQDFYNTLGTYTNTPTLKFKQSQNLHSANFSGSNYLEIPYTSALNTSQFTVSVWVYVTNNSSYQRIFDSFNIIGSNRYGFHVLQYENDSKFTFRIENGTSSIPDFFTNSFVLNEWRHYIFMYDGTKQIIYENGIRIRENAITLSLNTQQKFTIGARYSNDDFFHGNLYDFRYYNTGLSHEDIQRLFKLGRNPPNTVPVLHLPMNTSDPTKFVANDSSITTITNTGGVALDTTKARPAALKNTQSTTTTIAPSQNITVQNQNEYVKYLYLRDFQQVYVQQNNTYTNYGFDVSFTDVSSVTLRTYFDSNNQTLPDLSGATIATEETNQELYRAIWYKTMASNPGALVPDFMGSKYLTIPYNAAINTNTFSIALWYYVTSWDSYQRITASHYIPGERYGYEIYQNSTNQQFAFGLENGSTANQNDITTPSNLSLNTWYHIVVTYDGIRQKLYHKIRHSRKQAFSNYSLNTTNNTVIGSRGIAPENPFNGYLYDYRYYKRALTAQEIDAIYTRSALLGEEILHIPFNTSDPTKSTTHSSVGTILTPINNTNLQTTYMTTPSYGYPNIHPVDLSRNITTGNYIYADNKGSNPEYVQLGQPINIDVISVNDEDLLAGGFESTTYKENTLTIDNSAVDILDSNGQYNLFDICANYVIGTEVYPTRLYSLDTSKTGFNNSSGTANNLSIAYNSVFGSSSSEFTVGFWIKATNASNYGSSNYFLKNFTVDEQNGWGLYFGFGAGSTFTISVVFKNAGQATTITSNQILEIDNSLTSSNCVWGHVIVTYKANDLKLYFNKELQTQSYSVNYNPANNTSNVMNIGNGKLNGVLYDFRYINSVIDRSKLVDLYMGKTLHNENLRIPFIHELDHIYSLTGQHYISTITGSITGLLSIVSPSKIQEDVGATYNFDISVNEWIRTTNNKYYPTTYVQTGNKYTNFGVYADAIDSTFVESDVLSITKDNVIQDISGSEWHLVTELERGQTLNNPWTGESDSSSNLVYLPLHTISDNSGQDLEIKFEIDLSGSYAGKMLERYYKGWNLAYSLDCLVKFIENGKIWLKQTAPTQLKYGLIRLFIIHHKAKKIFTT